MEIRSITVFLPINNIGKPALSVKELISLTIHNLETAAGIRQVALQSFQEAGFAVQSCRLATSPFSNIFQPFRLEPCLEWVENLEKQSRQAGFDYLSVGPASPDQPETILAVVEIIKRTQNVFASALMTLPDSVSLQAVQLAARAIREISQIEPNGFANLRFAALANVSPGSPFFPAAYYRDERFAFALAIEAADLFIEEIEQARDFQDAQARLICRIEREAQRLQEAADKVLQSASKTIPMGTVDFLGIDFTPAPFPEFSRSFGTAMEKLGLESVGQQGSLASAAFLTNVLDQAHYSRTGFNGLMLPVLEDARLAQRAAQGKLHVKDLLLYATVCGTGLDTIPLAGDVSENALSALLLDLAALSLRLNKPLTARLMPIPGKTVGEETNFDFGYFANSHILAIDESPLSGLFSTSQRMPIRARNPLVR